MSREFLKATAAETSPSLSLMIAVVCFAVDCCTCQQEKSYLASPIPSFLQHANASSDSPGRVQFFQMLSVLSDAFSQHVASPVPRCMTSG